MSVDAGMVELAQRLADGRQPSGPGVSVTAGASLDVQVGRLCSLLERQARAEQDLAQAAAPIDLPPMDYAVTGGQPKFKTVRASSADASPQEGYIWFITRLSLAGLTVGDVVNLYRPAGVVLTPNAAALHTFTCPPGVAAGLGIADWEPGVAGLIMHPDDVFTLQSAGTLTATELLLTGQALQITAPYIAKFIL
jgi:hypothetical protein